MGSSPTDTFVSNGLSIEHAHMDICRSGFLRLGDCCNIIALGSADGEVSVTPEADRSAVSVQKNDLDIWSRTPELSHVSSTCEG